MKLTQIAAALQAAGYETNAEIDRIDVAYIDGVPSTLDVMLTSGQTDRIPALVGTR